jgi:coenzyme F420-reducing hydrogenase beta subunit
LCEKICPVLHPATNHRSEKDVTAYAAISSDESSRLESSSGGIFTLIASYIIEKGGVVFGAAFDENYQVNHFCAETKNSLQYLRGSKYVQSKIGDTYKQAEDFLRGGKTVLFSGTPCQIEGLLAYLQMDYPNLYTQDIACHGVPSPLIWSEYVLALKNRYRSSIESISDML